MVALIHDFEVSSNTYQIANRDHRSAPETCRLGIVLNQALKHVELGVCSNVSMYVQYKDLRGDILGSLPSLVASRATSGNKGSGKRVSKYWNLRRAPEEVVVHMSEFPAGLMKGSNHAVGRHKKWCERSGAIGSIINV